MKCAQTLVLYSSVVLQSTVVLQSGYRKKIFQNLQILKHYFISLLLAVLPCSILAYNKIQFLIYYFIIPKTKKFGCVG